MQPIFDCAVLFSFRMLQIISKEKRPNKGKICQWLDSLINIFLCLTFTVVSPRSKRYQVVLMWEYFYFLFKEKKTWGTLYWLKFSTSLPVPDVSVLSKSLCSLSWSCTTKIYYLKYLFTWHMKNSIHPNQSVIQDFSKKCKAPLSSLLKTCPVVHWS